MSWKVFTAVCSIISAALISVPQNIIGCGGGIDPYDYYISFFNQYAASQIRYRPFFYTNELFLFDYNEPVNTQETLVKEWVSFTGNTVPEKDVRAFIMKFPVKDIHTLYYHIERKTPPTLPDSISRNGMSQFFLKKKDLEALGYILYAKKVEPHVLPTDEWEPVTRDSITMDKLIKNGLQLYKAAKTDLFRLKYGYQIVRLAHYNNHYQDAIKYYDELVAGNPEKSILQPMSLALKAGALFRLKQHKESAYLFSKAFHMSPVKIVSNYYGFNWAVVKEADRASYLSLCGNDREKAEMLSLFALQTPEPDLNTLKSIYRLWPSTDIFSTLVVREINKYEEDYLTPRMSKEYEDQLNGIYYYYYYYYTPAERDSLLHIRQEPLRDFVNFLQHIATEKKVKDPALMYLAAAHGAYMLKDFATARSLLTKAGQMSLSPRLKDQWMLTNLLVTISQQEVIDAAFEANILPSIKWLYEKASEGTRRTSEGVLLHESNSEPAQWYRFYRNLMMDVLAKRYEAQGDRVKTLLAMGSSESLGIAGYKSAISYLRNSFDSPQAEKLYDFLSGKQFTPYEAFLVANNTIKLADVQEFVGTAYLREYHYDKAVSWLQQLPQQRIIEKNPFIDLWFDREERLPGDTVTTTQLAYALEMKKLHELAKTDKANAAQHLYKIALGLYNVTYYGYAWNLVEYFRSGSDGYFVPPNATPFQREYYTAATAESYFKKALEASADPEFKAKCLFMMARCSQKQVAKPRYGDYADYDTYEKLTDRYYFDFMNNKYYSLLKSQYGQTAFYKEALTRCSYLRDFVGK